MLNGEIAAFCEDVASGLDHCLNTTIVKVLIPKKYASIAGCDRG
jgi:hypothetical protein